MMNIVGGIIPDAFRKSPVEQVLKPMRKIAPFGDGCRPSMNDEIAQQVSSLK